MISSGSPHVRRAAATTVGNDRDRLLAPNRMTRRAGVLLFDELFKASFASRPRLPFRLSSDGYRQEFR
jgi:hypothetical protein